MRRWLVAMLLLVCAASAHAQERILFTHVDVFDGTAGELLRDANVLVTGELIEAVSAEPIDAEGARVIDGGGRTMIPGLIDMHWHTAFANIAMMRGLTTDLGYHMLIAAKGSERTLMRGFTTVRDMGGNVFSLKRLIDDGTYFGPRIYPSGPMIGQTSGHSDFRPSTAVPAEPDAALTYLERVGHVMVADGVPAVLQRVREALRLGASQIKVMSGGGVSSDFDPLDVTQYTVEETEAAVDAARDWNTYVAVHVFTDAAAQRALQAGVVSIEHGHLLGEETLRMMVDKGAYLSMQPILSEEGNIPFAEGTPNREKFETVTAGTSRVYELAKKTGVKTVFGSDILFDARATERQGAMLALLGRWFTPLEAMRQATSTAGELLALSGPRSSYQAGPLGVIRPGAYADLILVDGNPLENLDLVADPDTNFDLIMKGGAIYKDAM